MLPMLMIEPGAPRAAQMEDDLARQQKVGGHAGVIGAVEILGRGIVDVRRRAAVGVVDQDIDLAGLLDNLSHERRDRVGLILGKGEAEMAVARQASQRTRRLDRHRGW